MRVSNITCQIQYFEADFLWTFLYPSLFTSIIIYASYSIKVTRLYADLAEFPLFAQFIWKKGTISGPNHLDSLAYIFKEILLM